MMNFPVKITEDSFAARAARVVAIAAKHADTVDFEGRFPREAVDAMKAERLLSIQIPRSLGGESATTTEIAELCSMLGQACAASAMVFAMHHIKLSSLVEHGADSAWHADFMRRIAAEQLLIGSATTEGGIGGNLRNSICAVRSMATPAVSKRMRRSFPTARTPMRS
jgi:acyl-CoA dehydrogenase